MNNPGIPKHFDVEHGLEFVRQLVSADEVITALEVLDKFPAYYRDNPTTSMILCRENIYKKINTVQDYYVGEWQEIDPTKTVEEFERSPRFQYVDEVVRAWNDENRVPHITEFGPGQYWLPIGIKSRERKFTYKAITITGDMLSAAKDNLGDTVQESPKFNQPQIFVCFEVIEHLFNLSDVYNYYCRENLNAEHIFISTPKHCLGGGWKRDNAEMIAHIRTFTPNELMQFCLKYWPQYMWQFMDGVQMVAIGRRVNA